MITLKTLAIAASAALMVFSMPAQADTISDVEGARAKDRQGFYLNDQEREQVRRYGSNDDGYRRGGYGYGYDGYYGPSVGVYVGPSPYYGPYGY